MGWPPRRLPHGSVRRPRRGFAAPLVAWTWAPLALWSPEVTSWLYRRGVSLAEGRALLVDVARP